MQAKIDSLLGPVHRHDAVPPKELLELAGEAATLGDIRHARNEAARAAEKRERVEESQFAARARDYRELHDQVESSTTLLASLEAFISTFQNDLSAVSGHIADLQSRSKVIEARLENRKTVRNSLSPLLASITVSPALIQTLMETEPSEAWIQPVDDLEKALVAIRSGPRVSSRKDLEEVIEKLRIRVTFALRGFLINLFTPYRTSITPNLAIFHLSILNKYRSFFAFLQRHSARAAHEVQKAYISTAQWYYETGFRRYVRALERIRARSITRTEPVGSVSSESSLSLFSRQAVQSVQASSQGSRASMDTLHGLNAMQRSEESGVLLAYRADEPEFKATPEQLFRSISLVIADNARAEYAFISSFFGRPDDFYHPVTTEKVNVTFAQKLSRERPPLESASSHLSTIQDDDSISVVSEGQSLSHSATLGVRQGSSKNRAHATEHVWKQIFEPSLEYAKNFIQTMLTQSFPSALSLLSMIRLNDELANQLLGEGKNGTCPASAMESYLIGLRLQLWPMFQKEMGVQIDSVRKLADTGGVSGMAGLLGGRNASIKDSVVATVSRKYADLFAGIVQLSKEDDDMVFNSLSRLRIEVERLITQQAAKADSPAKKSQSLKTHYENIYQILTTNASTSHPRTQTETAYWRERSRKA